jgi:hypothetical protein
MHSMLCQSLAAQVEHRARFLQRQLVLVRASKAFANSPLIETRCHQPTPDDSGQLLPPPLIRVALVAELAPLPVAFDAVDTVYAFLPIVGPGARTVLPATLPERPRRAGLLRLCRISLGSLGLGLLWHSLVPEASIHPHRPSNDMREHCGDDTKNECYEHGVKVPESR